MEGALPYVGRRAERRLWGIMLCAVIARSCCVRVGPGRGRLERDGERDIEVRRSVWVECSLILIAPLGANFNLTSSPSLNDTS